MIRYVEIRAQDSVLLDNDGRGVRGFAWWCTVTDRFLSVGGSQAWATWGDFEADTRVDGECPVPIARFVDLFDWESRQ